MGSSMVQKGSDTIEVFDTSFKLTYPIIMPYGSNYSKCRNETMTVAEHNHLRARELAVHALCIYLHMYSNDSNFAIGAVNYTNYFDELRRRLNEIQFLNWALYSSSSASVGGRYKREERDILPITIDGRMFCSNIYSGGGADSSAVIYVFRKIATHTKDVALRAFLVNYLHDILGEDLTEEGGMEL